MRRTTTAGLAIALGLCLLSGRAYSDGQDALSGEWSVSGSNGSLTWAGTGAIDRLDDGRYEVKLSYRTSAGKKKSAYFLGTFDGKTLKGDRGGSPGIVSVFTGPKVKNGVPGAYTLSADKTTLEGVFGSLKETLVRTSATGVILVDANRDGKVDAKDKDALGSGKTGLVVLVPNDPGSVRSPLELDAPAPVILSTTGAGAIAVKDGAGQDVLGAKLSGKQSLSIVAAKSGDVEILAKDAASGKVLGSARVTVQPERLYLLMFGYEGTEIDYLTGDVGTTKKNLLPKLQQAGYRVIEDGSIYDQGAIAKGLADWNAPRKVLVDWCVSHDDWQAYLSRGSVRGWFWGSHGFMEPWTGCPDSELLMFESRQWTAPAGSPETTERKHFVREWKALMDKNKGALDFAIMHSCCTGGLGSYAPEAWEYCDPSTSARVQAKFGLLPEADKLDTSRSFQSLAGRFSFLQTFNGPSYFGLSDAKWSQAVAALKPND